MRLITKSRDIIFRFFSQAGSENKGTQRRRRRGNGGWHVWEALGVDDTERDLFCH